MSRYLKVINRKYITNSFHSIKLNGTSNVPVIGVVGTNRQYHISTYPQKRYGQSLNNNFTKLLCNKATVAPILPTIRFLSQDSTATVVSKPLVPIPEPPTIPIEIEPTTTTTAAETIITNLSNEPAFTTLGLGGWTPVGLVQNCLEYLHINLDIPWWGAIMIGTICVRTLILPLVVLAQRNAAKMSNNMPEMQTLQLKLTEAKQSGNQIEAARYAQEMMQFMKEKGLNPLKNMIVPLAQAPLFVSFFIGLRQMANAPVDSLREGGLFWFTDLTMPDQFYLLPIITSATLYATIIVGTDGAKLAAQNMQTMKYVLRAMPIIIFPFTVNFPGIILCYWCCSNFISLVQVGVLRMPAVRDFVKIERTIIHPPEAYPVKKKGFVEGCKDSWQNMKINRELAERERIDEVQFQRAGQGPLVKTYKHDPTKVRMPTVLSSTTVPVKKQRFN